MASNVDQAWAEMKSPKAEKYASRVKQVLSGSAEQGQKVKTLGFSVEVFNKVRATRHDEPTGQGGQERSTPTGTTDCLNPVHLCTTSYSEYSLYLNPTYTLTTYYMYVDLTTTAYKSSAVRPDSAPINGTTHDRDENTVVNPVCDVDSMRTKHNNYTANT